MEDQRFCILDTDVAEAEELMRQVGAKALSCAPDAFRGDVPAVFFRLRYTPPYEPFQELRKNIIPRLRQAAGLRSSYRGLICLDVSEYKGHETEEYFTVLLKYLYDKARGSRVILVCCQYTGEEVARVGRACLKWVPVYRETLSLYREETLARLIQAAGENQGIPVSGQAARLLASALTAPELASCRSLQLIRRLPREVRDGSLMSGKISATKDGREISGAKAGGEIIAAEKSAGRVTEEDVRAWLEESASSVCMMAGRPLGACREGRRDFGQGFSLQL